MFEFLCIALAQIQMPRFAAHKYHCAMPHIATDNPFLDWLGARISIWQDNFVEMHLDTTQHLLNRSGAIQGGVICTLLDAAAGYAVLAVPGDRHRRGKSATLSLTVNFLEASKGERLIAKGYVERRGRSIVFARSELLIGKDLFASATGTFKYSSPA